MTVQKTKAVELRKQGLSIRKIATGLGVSVGSAENWCRGIKLTERQKALIESNIRNPYYEGRGVYLRNLVKQTKLKIGRLKKEGKKEVGKLNKRDLFIAGIALYWAEGFKKDSQVGLATLDPQMALFFVKWLKTCFGYVNENLIFRVTANEAHMYRIDEIEKYWASVLDISKDQLQKPFYQKVKWKKNYDNPEEYFGVIRIRVRKSTDFLRKIHGFVDGLRLQAG